MDNIYYIATDLNKIPLQRGPELLGVLVSDTEKHRYLLEGLRRRAASRAGKGKYKIEKAQIILIK